VPVQKEVDWLIPLAVELFKSVAIPPVLVKLPVVEFAQLCEEIAQILEDQVKTQDDESCDRQHHPQNQLDQSHIAPLLDPGLDELRVHQVHRQQRRSYDPHLLEHVDEVYGLFARIVCVDQPRGDHKLDEVAESDVSGVVGAGGAFVPQSLLIVKPKIPTLICLYLLTVI